MEGFLIIIIFLVIIVLISRAGEEAKKEADKRSYKAMINSPEYIAQQEEKRKKELAYIKETLDKCRKNPDINIAIYNDEAWQVHMDRLNNHGRSMYSGEMYYKGQRGGIYTLSANGTRNYKY